MRVRTVAGGLTVNAVAGSYVVVLGLNVDEALRPGLRGFAIQREDKTEGETRWMKGTKTFASVEAHPTPGESFSSLEHPYHRRSAWPLVRDEVETQLLSNRILRRESTAAPSPHG